MALDFTAHPHRRYNLLTGEWILVSPQRSKRPWQGSVAAVSAEEILPYDPNCYLCPNNQRANGEKNPNYETTFVFSNDFAALLNDVPQAVEDEALLRYRAVQGTCRVLCFSPRHDLTLARLNREALRSVIDMWADQTAELGQHYRCVQLFENRGEMMGASNPHPHGQVWALDVLPNEILKEDLQQRRYLGQHQRPLLSDYERLERGKKQRVIAENDAWLVVVPFWATWPFETLLLPRRPVHRLPELDDSEREALADILKRLLVRYDNLFKSPFPYSMGWHGAPFVAEDVTHWQLHAHFYPPLLRSAAVRKFMVGYELLCEAQRDLTPERAADKLRNLSEIHYGKANT